MDTKKKTVSPHKGEWKAVAVKLPWLLLLPVFYGLSLLANAYPQYTEKYYSTSVYPVISRCLGWLSSVLPGVSFAECLLYALAVSVTVLLAIFVIRLLIGKIRLARFVSFLVSVCVLASVLFGLFYMEWGFNYSRPTLYSRMGLPVESRPVEELDALCVKLANDAAALRSQVADDENGVFTLSEGWQKSFSAVPAAYQALGCEYAMFARTVYPAKGVMASVGMSYGGIAGIFIPFTGEANVNVDQPALLLPSSAAHETAHYLGVAREDEANFVSYLACIHSDDPSIRYSGVMLALINCTNKLYSADQDRYAEIRSHYSQGMLRDLADYNAYWAGFEGPVEEAVNNMNDNYLKFNQQDSGVKSYGMMVDLLLAYYAVGEAS